MKFQYFSVMAAFMIFQAATAQSLPHSQRTHSLDLRKIISLPNVKGRIDHMDIDLKTDRVFIAALENNTVEVVNLKEGKWLRSLKEFEEPQGVLFLPELNRLYITNGGAGTCSVLDASTLETISAIPGLDDADNIRLDKAANKIYVAYGSGGLAVIDPKDAKVTHTLPLSAHPESFQLEKKGNRIYVNVPNEGKIVVFDKQTRQTIAKWTVKEAESNFPMALDEEHQVLFVGCRVPAKLLVIDTKSGSTISVLPIGGDVDDVFFDSGRHRLYVSCGEGVVDVFVQKTADKYDKVDQFSSRNGARTSLFIPSLNTLLVVGKESGGEAAQLRVYSVHDP